jgi:excisionase family DNA binding protein
MDFMPMREFQQRMGMSHSAAYRALASGRVPAVRFGRLWRIPRAAWDQWIKEQTEQALAAAKRGSELPHAS